MYHPIPTVCLTVLFWEDTRDLGSLKLSFRQFSFAKNDKASVFNFHLPLSVGCLKSVSSNSITLLEDMFFFSDEIQDQWSYIWGSQEVRNSSPNKHNGRSLGLGLLPLLGLLPGYGKIPIKANTNYTFGCHLKHKKSFERKSF